MALAIANPTIRVNDETISIVPNSVNVIGGYGETNIRAASAGGSEIETIHTVNAESKIGSVTFEIYNTPEYISKIAGWKNAVGSNTIQVIGNLADGSAFSQSFRTMSLMNDPEQALSADGTTSLEWKGNPVTQG